MPAALAPMNVSRPFGIGDVHVDVSPARTVNGDLAREYIVTLRDAHGAPYSGADVRLRGRMSDGGLVEAALEPGARPGLYQASLIFRPDGPWDLRVRVSRGTMTFEVPLRAAGSSVAYH